MLGLFDYLMFQMAMLGEQLECFYFGSVGDFTPKCMFVGIHNRFFPWKSTRVHGYSDF